MTDKQQWALMASVAYIWRRTNRFKWCLVVAAATAKVLMTFLCTERAREREWGVPLNQHDRHFSANQKETSFSFCPWDHWTGGREGERRAHGDTATWTIIHSRHPVMKTKSAVSLWCLHLESMTQCLVNTDSHSQRFLCHRPEEPILSTCGDMGQS